MRIRAPRPTLGEDITPDSAPPQSDAAARTGVAGTDWPGSVLLNDPVSAKTLYRVWSGDPAVVVKSPPGAGKTWLAVQLAQALACRAGLRVGIAAQTKTQAIEIAARLSERADVTVLMWKKDTPAPGSGATPVVASSNVRWPSRGGGIIVAVTARWLQNVPERVGADVMIVDEAYQCTHADLGALGAMAPQIVCVGDPGQIAPVVVGETTRWAANPAGPHVPAPQALLAAHADSVGLVQLRHTWRLGPETTALISPSFYPDLPFASCRPPEHLATAAGERLPELARQPVTPTEGWTDPVLIAAAADRVRELLTTTLFTADQARPMTDEDIAVVVARVAQESAIKAALADHPGVLVGTANSLQGLERPAVVALHPAAGYREAEPFVLDPARACVMLSRHRAHLTVIYDTATAAVLEHAEPSPHRDLNIALLTALSGLPTA